MREASSLSQRDDWKETQVDQSSEEEARSESTSSSTDDWSRRERHDTTPSTQVVKCFIEALQADMEGIQQKKTVGMRLATDNNKENGQRTKDEFL